MTTQPVSSRHVLEHGPPQRSLTNDMSLSLTLALKDGASGTTPLSHQQTALSLLKADVPYVAIALLRILSAAAASIINCRRETSWAELRDMVLYFLLSLLELQLLFSVCLLWLIMPGLALLPWLGLQAASVWVLLHYMNSGRAFSTCPADTFRDGASGSEERQLEWFVVGGFVRMRQGLPAKLVQLFGHDMHVFLPDRLGLMFDAIFILLQRNLYIPTTKSAALYNRVRTSLLKPETSGIRILVHHTGALDISWLLARLCADLPPGDHLSKLQVFTFGAASIEMALPLGRPCKQSESISDSLYPSVTHFAFTDDPFAQIGVLLGIRQRFEGRFVGSLYTIHGAARAPARSRLLPRDCHYTFDDYLDALLPEGDSRAGVLGQVCKIDRELSEMRELAALAQNVTSEQLRTCRARLSWTALGVVANTMSSRYKKHHDMAGPYSLEDIRKKAKSLEGLRGFENNPLADAVKNRYYTRPRE